MAATFEDFKQRCNRDFKTVNRLENTTNLSEAMVGHWAGDLYSGRAQRDTAGQKVQRATNTIASKDRLYVLHWKTCERSDTG